jgi:thioredoxin reductase
MHREIAMHRVDIVGARSELWRDAADDAHVALDEEGYVRVDAMTRETSVAGIYAAGDMTTRTQGAILAAASSVQAAAMMNLELTMDLATSGVL